MSDVFAYDVELAQFPDTLHLAVSADITELKKAISASGGSSVIGVGSGGSFTVASLLCSLHEAFTGHVSRVSTPLELICNPTLAVRCPVFLVSAEGKNPDIVEALNRSRLSSSRPVHILTNRANSELVTVAATFPEVKTFVFELSGKDGYLATNSLLLDAALIARAYSELDGATGRISSDLEGMIWSGMAPNEWLLAASNFAERAMKRRGLLLVYSPNLRAVAADLESKLSESALTFCQAADIRSFAHGRHLWLSEQPDDCAVFALVDPEITELWDAMKSQVPLSVPMFDLTLQGSQPPDQISGLVALLNLVGMMARAAQRDIGRPRVAEFGRQLYYANLSALIPAKPKVESVGEQSKSEVLGSRWPAKVGNGPLRRALKTFRSELEERRFRAIVFDYDGTLSPSQINDGPLGEGVRGHLERLLSGGIVIGVASGRGDSLQTLLREQFASAARQGIRLALYNGGWIGGVDEAIETSGESEYLSHANRVVVGLKLSGVPIDSIRLTGSYQISIRFSSGVNAETMWMVICDALRQAGLDNSTVFRSKHSVDILSRGVSKSHLVAKIVQEQGIDPYEVVTMGDLGAWPGNDSSLLEHRFSLSVDQPSRRLDRGWKLAPDHFRDVDATAWYLERLQILRPGYAKFDLRVDP